LFHFRLFRLSNNVYSKNETIIISKKPLMCRGILINCALLNMIKISSTKPIPNAKKTNFQGVKSTFLFLILDNVLNKYKPISIMLKLYQGLTKENASE